MARRGTDLTRRDNAAAARQARPVEVLIATPTAHGTVTTAYARTLVSITQVLGRAGAGYALLNVDYADVPTARNVLAHAFMGDAGFTHLLFLDSDMGVDPEVIRRILGLRAPIAGVAYPERRIDVDVLARALSESQDVERAKALASAFALRISPGRKQIRDDVMEVDGVGFGCVLIEKPLMQRLVDRGLAPPLESDRLREAGLTGAIHDFFGTFQLEGQRASEDYAFCERVRLLGDVPILAYVGPGVAHFGQFAFDAVFRHRLITRPGGQQS